MAKKTIIISGTPGSGKTTIAKLLAKKTKAKLIDINKFAINKKLIVGFDKKFKSKIIDIKKLSKYLQKEIRKIKQVILEGHLGCELKLKADYVIILRLNPKKLFERLKKRNYSKLKIKENLMAEALDYCTILAQKNFKKSKIIEIDCTNKNAKDISDLIYRIVFLDKKYKIKKISWIEQIEEIEKI
jgi:adenylate kinase